VGTAEVGDQRRGVHGTDRRDAADAQRAPDQSLERVKVGAHAVHLSERAPPSRQYELARLGHVDATGGAPQQLDAQPTLEPAHLLRDRRLCDVEVQRGLGERAAAGDGVQVVKLAELHAGPIIS
jgi:hypothetical protein